MTFSRQTRALALAATCVAAWAGIAAASLPAQRQVRPSRVARPTHANTTDIDRRIDVNQLNMFVTNKGSFAFDLGTGNSGLYFPKGTSKTAIFAAGLWIGCKVGGETRAVVAEYSQEFNPGVILPGGAPSNPSNPDFVVYKVARFSGNPADTTHIDRESPNELAGEDPLIHHSWSEYMRGAVPYGAPTRVWDLPDPNNPGSTIPVTGPDILGDQMMWAVYNDADPTAHTNDAGASEPLGIEVQQTTFAFNRQGALGNTAFLKYRLINKGTQTLTDMYLSQWSDPDLGGATDDLVGCDTLPDPTGKPRSLGYCYNATNNDQLYGSAPPAVGFDFFKGPVVGGDTLGMASFDKYINGTDPASAEQTYNYMTGLTRDGDPVVDPFGNTTTFFHAGDPVAPGPTDWLDTNPSDRRLLLSTGPFTMAPGDTQEIVVAVLVGQGSNRLSSISSLRFNDNFAQDAFDKDFDLPSPPSQPVTDYTTDHQTVTLSWDSGSRESYSEPGYTFEGYNVYQGASVAGPWKLIATYDEIDNIRVIYDEVFDVETGQTIPQFPVAFGSDNGVKFSHTVTQDAVRGGSLKDGTQYYFAVTSYAYDPTGLPKVLENAQQVISVIPQRPPSGTDPSTASATDVTYLRKDGSKPPATDVVSVEVVDPEAVTGHTYKVTFQPVTNPQTITVGTDTATVKYTWSLVDSTTGQVKYSGRVNKRTDDDFRVIDGLRVRVNGAYFPAFQDVAYFNNNTAHRRAYTGVNFGLPFFFGGGGSGADFFGSTIDPVSNPDQFSTVELRFSTTNTQKTYRYLRRVDATDPDLQASPPSGRGYTYGGFVTSPFQAWDVTNNVQLDVGYVERIAVDPITNAIAPNQPATLDSMWSPLSDDLDTGGREYLAIYRSVYSDTPKDEFREDGHIFNEDGPILYALTATLRAASDVVDDGDLIRFTWANPATDNDVYVFNTQSLQRGNSSLSASVLDRVRVVPNPYYARSTYEINQFNRVIRFMNMPEQCTVRIFNLAGQLVRTIRKTDSTSSVLNWDLQTDRGLPVGSGVYVYHVDIPGVGETFGKLVVFMEQERLNNY